MIPDGLDPELIQDFLTESGELIDQLDADLVSLETESEPKELLDQIFRALHTIKGSASFLNLGHLTEFAHAAEDALNQLRKGEAEVTEHVIDALLQSIDVLRGQLEEVGEGVPPSSGPSELVDRLHAIAAGSSASTADDDATGEQSEASECPSERPTAFGGAAKRVEFPEQKLDVLPFMVSDLKETAQKLGEAAAAVQGADTREGAGRFFLDLSESLKSTIDFFELDVIMPMHAIIDEAGSKVAALSDECAAEFSVRGVACGILLEAFAEELEDSMITEWPLDTLRDRAIKALSGEVDPEGTGHSNDPESVLDVDGVTANALPTVEEEEATAAPAPQPGSPEPAQAAGPAQKSSPGAGKPGGGGAEQTIRVEVERLEQLMNLVGEMVLTKNQVLGVTRQLRSTELPQELLEVVGTVAGALDRLTGELQIGVMRTRMQPLGKLFGKYPRIIRDLAQKTNKKVDLVIEGGDTEVDKTVLEMLGDPLVHMLRNSVDHGLEEPADRIAAGKDETGTIRLTASHQGGHVCVTIEDNGRGINREVIANKAIEKGLATADSVATMSDSEIFAFIFAAGFSTAAQVSDLSGRGVGMDVVRTNITKLGGQINVDSTLGEGTTIEVSIPLTVAIMPAMVVGVGANEYAVPITCIHEIVRPEPEALSSVAGKPVMRLRESVLPLVDTRTLLNVAEGEDDRVFVVVVSVGQQSAGLIVDRIVGQQEVVIKPLEDEYTQGGPFSGATIREDGEVSLILDAAQVIRTANTAELMQAAS